MTTCLSLFMIMPNNFVFCASEVEFVKDISKGISATEVLELLLLQNDP